MHSSTFYDPVSFCTYSTRINVDLFVCNLKNLLSLHKMTYCFLAKILIKSKIIFFPNMTPHSHTQYIGPTFGV
jgi:hypothetical protein